MLIFLGGLIINSQNMNMNKEIKLIILPGKNEYNLPVEGKKTIIEDRNPEIYFEKFR
jgi:hypothetical protein